MILRSLLGFAGTLIPVLFPDKEFRPKRAVAVLVSFVVAIVAIKYLGVEGTTEALEIAEGFLELTEE